MRGGFERKHRRGESLRRTGLMFNRPTARQKYRVGMGDGCLRGSVNDLVYSGYRRRFYRLNFPMILTFSVSPN